MLRADDGFCHRIIPDGTTAQQSALKGNLRKMQNIVGFLQSILQLSPNGTLLFLNKWSKNNSYSIKSDVLVYTRKRIISPYQRYEKQKNKHRKCRIFSNKSSREYFTENKTTFTTWIEYTIFYSSSYIRKCSKWSAWSGKHKPIQWKITW